MILHLHAVNHRGPVPAKLIEGFDHRKAGLANAVLRGAVSSQVGLALRQSGQIVDMRPLLDGGLLGQFVVVLGHKGQLQVAQMLIELTWRHLELGLIW